MQTPDWPPCVCGKVWPLFIDDATFTIVESLVSSMGPEVPVSIGVRTWRVPRRCIAFHGITSAQLLNGVFTEQGL